MTMVLCLETKSGLYIVIIKPEVHAVASANKRLIKQVTYVIEQQANWVI